MSEARKQDGSGGERKAPEPGIDSLSRPLTLPLPSDTGWLIGEGMLSTADVSALRDIRARLEGVAHHGSANHLDPDDDVDDLRDAADAIRAYIEDLPVPRFALYIPGDPKRSKVSWKNRDYDRYFNVVRVHGDPLQLLAHAVLLTTLGVLEELARYHTLSALETGTLLEGPIEMIRIFLDN